MTTEKFWIEDISELFRNPSKILPLPSMTKDEKLNALTRLVLLVTVVLYFAEFKKWLYFLLFSLLIIIVLKYNCSLSKTEHFTMTPTYTSTDFHQTTVAPLFAEEWHDPPPAYDIYTPITDAKMRAFEGRMSPTNQMKPQSYPYGQYLTRTNLLPSDEYYTHMLNGGTKKAREYVNSAFLRNDLAFRDNISRIYKKTVQRRFRHRDSCGYDSYSPFVSY